MIFESTYELRQALKGAVKITGDKLEVVDVAKSASLSMETIRTSAETVRHAIESISDALREQKTSSVDLARNVESIAQMSEENSAAVDSVSSTAQHLVELSGTLKSSVARFRL